MAEVSQRVPWRNGGGWTQVLAQSAGREPVEWRISVADIERNGPFSDYAGYDRTIVSEDRPFTLEFADGECAEIQPLQPFSFAGERAVFCRLHGAPATAFNVITLRHAFQHEVRVVDDDIEVSFIDVLAEPPYIQNAFESFDDWEHARRVFATWEGLVKLRFAQDVHDARARAASDKLDDCAPLAQRRDAAMMRRLIESPEQARLQARIGRHAFTRWRQNILAFDPAIEHDLAREAGLYRQYTQLSAAAGYRFRGEEKTAAEMSAFARHERRDIRRAATQCVWKFYGEHAATYDRIFDGLVRSRTAMARTLRYRSYADLAYVRLGRTDYTRSDVWALRQRIEQHIVPLCAAVVGRQAADLGIEAVMPWDELVFDRRPPQAQAGEPARILSALSSAFAYAHPELGAFADLMTRGGLIDLEARAGKRAGAFCTFLPMLGVPHVFAHFTGTSQDVGSLVHEMGHAFQDYSARNQPTLEQIIPTAETGEVFSLGLEYLLWPFYGEFFGGDADRYRAQHLKTMLLMLPYIAAVDHFQELVYDNPEACLEDRYRFWLDVSERYLPHRSNGELPHLARGGAWHRQHHIFGFPFYYIDYALALFAVFDLWRQSAGDYDGTMERYVAMAGIGGRVGLRELLAAHRIADPFAEGTIEATVWALQQSKELG